MEIKLTDKETQDITNYFNAISQLILTMGNLRKQYLQAENEFMNKIEKAETQYLSHLRFIFQSKSEENIDDWSFDYSTFTFKKK